MKKHLIYWLAAFVIVMVGCQKELSFEGSNSPAEGSLQADVTGDCLPKTVNGTYVAATALIPATNTISVQVIVAKTGTYEIVTDTVNGYYFRAASTFTTLGATTVTLRGNGTPFAAGVNNFVVSFDSTFCDIQVTVLPAGSGPAVFTLVSGGTPVNCASAVVAGTYVKDAVLNATNYADIMVNVATIGSYTIKATGGGMIFQSTGTFAATGNQSVRLFATGSTPTTVGANTITFDPPFASCNFTVTVVAPVAGTLGGGPGACAPITVNGTYTNGVALTAANTVQVQITTSVVGPYAINTNTVAGFSFSASGTSNGATQTITLNGTGTPTASGPQNFTVTFGTSTCTFTVTVLAPVGGTLGGGPGACTPVTINGTYTNGVPLTAGNTVQVQITTSVVGPYSVTTGAPVAGISFSASGTSNGATQTITLNGTGTPTASGVQNFTVTFGTSTCTFSITIGAGGSAYTPDCSTATYDGLYEVGTQLNCSNIIVIDVNVTATGPYNITTALTNGMTFSASGTFSVTGITTLTLVGSGTPVTATTSNIPIPGTTPCTVPLTVDAASPPYGWQFTRTNAPSTVYRGQTDAAAIDPGPNPPGILFSIQGSNTLGTDGLIIVLSDANGTIVNGETYSTSALTGNQAGFQYDLATSSNCSDTYSADPTISGVSITFTVTSHNVATQTITGTFTGTAKNVALQTITITSGTFTGTY